MATQPATRHLPVRRTAMRGAVAVALFIVVAVLAEFLVVIYAMDLGVSDPAPLKTNWPVTIVISPLFNLAPLAVIVTLAFTWVYLSRKFAVKGQELRKGKVQVPARRGAGSKKILSRIGRPLSGFLARIRPVNPSVKGALAVILLFLLFVVVASLLAYPQLIYRAVSSAYQNNPSLLDFVLSVDKSVKGFAEAVSPIGWIGTSVNNALLGGAAGVGGAGKGLGSLLGPVADLDNPGKYLVFQNAAAWISVFLILFYGEFLRKGYRYRRK